MDIKIFFRGIDVVVAHHLFNFIDGGAGLQQILGIGVPQPVGCSRQSRFSDTFGDMLADRGGGDGSVRRHQIQKKSPVLAFGSCADDIGGNGFNGVFRKGKLNWAIVFSIRQDQLRLCK